MKPVVPSAQAETAYYSVFFTKQGPKKRKVAEDGILILNGTHAILQDMEGKQIAREMNKKASIKVGYELSVGMYDLEVVGDIDKTDYRSGKVFVNSPALLPGNMDESAGTTAPSMLIPKARPKISMLPGTQKSILPLQKPLPKLTFKSPLGARIGDSTKSAVSGKIPTTPSTQTTEVEEERSVGETLPSVKLGVGQRTGRVRMLNNAGTTRTSTIPSTLRPMSRPLYNPDAPGAVLLQVPQNKERQVPVVLDPRLARKMRPHQIEGVKFLWKALTASDPISIGSDFDECTFSGGNGTRAAPVRGAILADGMGLGKTLQTIALIWTALKQSGTPGVPLTRKVIVVCPSSLVANWQAEFRKWLGNERCRPISVTQQGTEAEQMVTDFTLSAASVTPVLILSYEMLRKHADILVSGTGSRNIGLLVADEAHRLKSVGGNKTIDALISCPARYRVLLTGTPIQNNLDEFFAMTRIAAPNVLGTLQTFRRNFAIPIQKGRDKSAAKDEVQLGQERAKTLYQLCSTFMLQRGSEVLEAFLPPKTELLVMTRLSPLQSLLYKSLVRTYTGSNSVSFGSDEAMECNFTPTMDSGYVLMLLNILRKCCIHPDLLFPKRKRQYRNEIDSFSKELYVPEVVVASHSDTENGDESPVKYGKSDSSKQLMIGKKRYLPPSEDDTLEDPNIDDLETSDSELDEMDNNNVLESYSETFSSDCDDILFPSEVTKKAPRPPLLKKSSVHSIAPHQGEDALLEPLMSVFPNGYAPLDSYYLQQIESFKANGTSVAFEQKERGRYMRQKLLDHLFLSSKLEFVSNLIDTISTSRPGQKIVLVSNFATVLDYVQVLCYLKQWSWVRLDGKTPSNQRQGLVDAFNRPPWQHGHTADGASGSKTGLTLPEFPDTVEDFHKAVNVSPPGSPYIFLLSAAAGGVGLNLVGASQLILLDANWNPAIDKQALARVWRDGQKQHTFIYRITAPWTIDEKIVQRQLMKLDVAEVVGGGASSDATNRKGSLQFSYSELKDLFSLNPDGAPSYTLYNTAGTNSIYGCDSYSLFSKVTTIFSGKNKDKNASNDEVSSSALSSRNNRDWPEFRGSKDVVDIDAVLSCVIDALDNSRDRNIVTYTRATQVNVHPREAHRDSSLSTPPVVSTEPTTADEKSDSTYNSYDTRDDDASDQDSSDSELFQLSDVE